MHACLVGIRLVELARLAIADRDPLAGGAIDRQRRSRRRLEQPRRFHHLAAGQRTLVSALGAAHAQSTTASAIKSRIERHASARCSLYGTGILPRDGFDVVDLAIVDGDDPERVLRRARRAVMVFLHA